MKALHFNEKLSFVDVPAPVPAGNEALIKVSMAGICNTDIEIVQGYMGFTGIPGHEFTGVVSQCQFSPDLVGKRVVGEINISAMSDSLGKRHDPARDVLGIVAKNGCLAEYITLPVENLHIVPDSVSDEEAVFVEPLAAALEILEQIRVPEDSSVAVLGDGKLGLLVAQVMARISSSVTLIGRHDNKLELARSWGITTVLFEANNLPDEKFDIVVDCTGNPDGLTAAITLTRPRGTLVLKTTTAAAPEFHTAPIVIDEITIVGSRCGPFEPALEWLERRQIDVKSLIDQTIPFDDALRAFAEAQRPGALKILLRMK